MTLFAVLAALLVALALQRLFLKKGLTGLEAEYRISPSAAEPGSTVELILTFRNRSRLLLPYVRYQLSLPRGLSLTGDAMRGVRTSSWGSETVLEGTVWLRPRQCLQRHIPLAAPERGWYPLRSMSVYGGDFLGLEETRQDVSLLQELVVYPREAELADTERILGGFLGDLSVRRFLFEDPVLTLGYRDYTGREPMRAISWTQSARRGELMVKNYDHTMDPAVTVVLNVRHGGDGALLERCFSLARSVCANLEKKGVKYGFSTNAMLAGAVWTDGRMTEGLGPGHFHAVLECLGRAASAAGLTPAQMSEQLLGIAAHGVIFITPDRDAEVEDAVRLARQGGLSVTVICAKEVC